MKTIEIAMMIFVIFITVSSAVILYLKEKEDK